MLRTYFGLPIAHSILIVQVSRCPIISQCRATTHYQPVISARPGGLTGRARARALCNALLPPNQSAIYTLLIITRIPDESSETYPLITPYCLGISYPTNPGSRKRTLEYIGVALLSPASPKPSTPSTRDSTRQLQLRLYVTLLSPINITLTNID